MLVRAETKESGELLLRSMERLVKWHKSDDTMPPYSRIQELYIRAGILGEMWFLMKALMPGFRNSHLGNKWEGLKGTIRSQDFDDRHLLLRYLGYGMQLEARNDEPEFRWVRKMEKEVRAILGGSDVYPYLGMSEEYREFTPEAHLFTAALIDLSSYTTLGPDARGRRLGNGIQEACLKNAPDSLMVTLDNAQRGAALWIAKT